MKHPDTPSRIRIDVAQAETDEHLLMMVATGSDCDFHHITLAQARALSLELIKHAYRAELRNSLGKPLPEQAASFP